MSAENILNLLLAFLVFAAQGAIAFYIGRIAGQLAGMAKGFRDATTAMVVDFSDSLTRFELLVKEMKREHDAESGRDPAPIPPNLPRLSGPARHAADPSGEWTGMPLREALHDNKTVLPVLVEECYICRCTATGWSGPHCHYHGNSVPEGYDRCPYLGMASPLS